MGSTLQDEMARLNREFCEHNFNPVTQMYVDLESIQDFGIGTLMTMISSEIEFAYIRRMAERYSKAWDRQIAHHFPALKFIEEQVHAAMQDPKRAEAIAIGSPLTGTYIMLLDYLKVITENNAKAYGRQTKAPITVYVGCSRIKYSSMAKARLRSRLAIAHPQVILQFLDGDVNTMHPLSMRKLQFFLIDDIVKFLDPANVTGKIFFSEHCWTHVPVYTHFQVDMKAYPQFDASKIEAAIIDSEALFGLCADFHFIQREIPMAIGE